jgi:hypothetical protein
MIGPQPDLVAFAALFIGLGSTWRVRPLREERHNDDDLERSLLSATRGIGSSLTLAAVSLLAGFFCFLPTSFSGVSELGLIAGVGMIVAYIATLTFLPAAVKLLRPRAEHVPIGHVARRRGPLDRHHRAFVLIAWRSSCRRHAGADHPSTQSMNLRDQGDRSRLFSISRTPRRPQQDRGARAVSARDWKRSSAAEIDHVIRSSGPRIRT